jgi:hypothetical protein
MEKQKDGDSGRDGQGHLDPAADPEIPLDSLQPGRLELQADGEKEHDDADLGQDVDRLGIFHQMKAAGADQDASQEKPDDGGESQLMGEIDDEDRSGQDDDEFSKDNKVHDRGTFL